MEEQNTEQQTITVEDIRRLCPRFEKLEDLATYLYSDDFEECLRGHMELIVGRHATIPELATDDAYHVAKSRLRSLVKPETRPTWFNNRSTRRR